MKFIDQITAGPAHVGFGQRGGGGGALDIRADGDSVELAPGQDLGAATATLAGVMTAVDRAKLDALVNSAGPVGPTDLESRLQAELTEIDPGVAFLRTAGRAAANDGGGGIWRRAQAEPAHAGKLRSADGAWWELIRDGQNSNLQFGAFAGSDRTQEFADFLAFIAGGRGQIVADPAGGTYLASTLRPAANTHLTIAQGVELQCMPTGTFLLDIRDPDIHVRGYGATLRMSGSTASHGIHIFTGAHNCSVAGLKVIGAGRNGQGLNIADCVYVGGNPAANDVARNIRLIDIIADGDGEARNALSVAGGDGVLIEGGEYFNARAAPGLGIDIEANRFMADGTSSATNITIRGARVHSNPNNFGIGVTFGDRVLIDDCVLYANGHGGINLVTNGTAFKADVFRPGDVLGVGAFDTSEGWITITDGTAGSLLTDDLGIVEGMYVGRSAPTQGAAWPAELNTTYQIVEIDPTQTRVKLGTAPGVDVVVPSTSGTGPYRTDPAVAGLTLLVRGRDGNAVKSHIRNCRIDNSAVGGEAVQLQSSRDAVVEGCDIVTTGHGIASSYFSLARLLNNRIRYRGDPGLVHHGIDLNFTSQAQIAGNYVEGFPGFGVNANAGSGAQYGPDEIVNCGFAPGGQAYQIQLCAHAVLRATIRNDAAHQPAHGVRLRSTATGCLVQGTIARGVGASNVASLSGGTGTVWRDCIQWDGSFKA